MTYPVQTLIVQKGSAKKHKVGPLDAPVALVNPDGSAFTGGSSDVTSASITDASDVGKSVLTATDAEAARAAIGAGTSNLAIGTTATTALAGNTAIPAAYTLPAATKDNLGGVKLTEFGTAFPDLAHAAGETPTAAEHDALVDAVNRIKGALVASGVVSIPA